MQELPNSQSHMRAIIETIADRYGVPRNVALAFAWCESKLNPRAEGDLQWHKRDGGQKYQQHVLRSLRLHRNPARDEPDAWHSYGLFQLLACYHVPDTEHPRELLDPIKNSEIAMRFIRSLLKRTGGDAEAARVLYVGLPLEGPNTQAERALVLTKFRRALERFESSR